MDHSRAATVDAYLAQAPPDRRALLARIRNLARRVLRDHDERMQWGMPAYVRDGRIRFGFADRKQYLSLYFVDPETLRRNAAAVAALNRGKGCLRFRRSTPVDWELIEKLLADTRRRPAADNRPETDGRRTPIPPTKL